MKIEGEQGRRIAVPPLQWKVVGLAVLTIVALTVAASFLGEESTGAANQAVWYAWLLAAFAVGWKVSRAGVLKAGVLGAVFGFCAEGLLYVVVLAGAYLGVFGVAVNWALVQPVEVVMSVAVLAGMGAARGAAVAALGALVAVFVGKMKEAE